MSEDTRPPLLSRRAKYALALLMVIAVLAGYVGYLYRSARSVQVRSISLESISVKGLQVCLTIGMDVYNPAIQSLRADKISYAVFLENTYLGSGETGPVELTPRSLTHVSLPLNVSLTSLSTGIMPALMKAASRSEVKIMVRGTVTLEIKLPGLRVGRLTLPYTLTQSVQLVS